MTAKRPMGQANGSFIALAEEQRTQIAGLVKALEEIQAIADKRATFAGDHISRAGNIAHAALISYRSAK